MRAILVTDSSPSSSFTPFAARTQQYFKEQIGTADDKVCAAH